MTTKYLISATSSLPGYASIWAAAEHKLVCAFVWPRSKGLGERSVPLRVASSHAQLLHQQRQNHMFNLANAALSLMLMAALMMCVWQGNTEGVVGHMSHCAAWHTFLHTALLFVMSMCSIYSKGIMCSFKGPQTQPGTLQTEMYVFPAPVSLTSVMFVRFLGK